MATGADVGSLRFADGPPAVVDRPLAIVHGNCQAESIRQTLPDGVLVTVRIPPVHELLDTDVALLRRWLARASVLVSQPIRGGYRGLAIGTAEVIAAAPDAAVVLVPVIRFAGLYPEQAIIRPPRDPSAVPPIVAYHSLRTLAAAAGHRLRLLTPAAVHTIARESVAALADRERRHGTLVVSDLLDAPSFELMRTVNHPGNPLWLALAERISARLGLDAGARDPGRPLLASIRAPRDPAVIEAFGLEDEPLPTWTVDGTAIDPAEVHAAHLAWYARHPDVVRAGVDRHRRALAAIGMR